MFHQGERHSLTTQRHTLAGEKLTGTGTEHFLHSAKGFCAHSIFSALNEMLCFLLLDRWRNWSRGDICQGQVMWSPSKLLFLPTLPFFLLLGSRLWRQPDKEGECVISEHQNFLQWPLNSEQHWQQWSSLTEPWSRPLNSGQHWQPWSSLTEQVSAAPHRGPGTGPGTTWIQ